MQSLNQGPPPSLVDVNAGSHYRCCGLSRKLANVKVRKQDSRPLEWGFASLISSHGSNKLCHHRCHLKSPTEALCCFSRQKNSLPLALVITERNCHKPVIIREPSIFQYLRAQMNFANPCTFPPFKAHFKKEKLFGFSFLNVSQHTLPGVREDPREGIQFLLWPIEHTYGWKWLIKHFLSSLDFDTNAS